MNRLKHYWRTMVGDTWGYVCFLISIGLLYRGIVIGKEGYGKLFLFMMSNFWWVYMMINADRVRIEKLENKDRDSSTTL